MIRTIIVPLDGSPLAEKALRPAAALCRRHGSELVLVHVQSRSFSFQGAHPSLNGHADAYLEQQCAQLAAEGLTARSSLSQGDAAQAILAAVAAEGADLLVMSTHGRSGVQRLLLGSVAAHILHATTVPVMLVREVPTAAKAPGNGLSRILIPLDGSSCAEEALEYAVREGLCRDREVLLLRSVPSLVGSTAHGIRDSYADQIDLMAAIATDDALLEARQYLEHAAATYLDGISYRLLPLSGYPARRILDVAQDQAVELLVMVSHERLGMDKLLNGSVADHVLRHTQVPLLILRHHDQKQRHPLHPHLEPPPPSAPPKPHRPPRSPADWDD